MDKALTAEVARLADGVEQLLAREQRRAQREHWQTVERPARAPESIGVGTFLAAIPGLAARFAKTVPDTHVQDRAVSCTCGEKVAVMPGKLASCTCGRWFLHAGSSIRVHRPAQTSD